MSSLLSAVLVAASPALERARERQDLLEQIAAADEQFFRGIYWLAAITVLVGAVGAWWFTTQLRNRDDIADV